jgi:hypothetical protein
MRRRPFRHGTVSGQPLFRQLEADGSDGVLEFLDILINSYSAMIRNLQERPRNYAVENDRYVPGSQTGVGKCSRRCSSGLRLDAYK